MRWWHFLIIGVLGIGLTIVITHYRLKAHTRQLFNKYAAQGPYDVIIIPGIAYDTAHVNSMFNTRILWASGLFKRGIAKNIIFSGGAIHSPYTEATAMMLVADSLGIPVQHIYCETNARHTKENIYYGWQMAHKLGFTKIAVATDPFQSSYIEKFALVNFPHIALLPLDVDSVEHYNQKLPVINAITALVKDFVPLEDKEGFFTRIHNATSTDLPQNLPDSVMQKWKLN